jgi:hypothetical protein
MHRLFLPLFLLLASASAQGASCDLRDGARDRFVSVALEGCPGNAAGYCVAVTTRNGQVLHEQLKADLCNGDGSACMLKGRQFSAALYAPKGAPERAWVRVYPLKNRRELAVCQKQRA